MKDTFAKSHRSLNLYLSYIRKGHQFWRLNIPFHLFYGKHSFILFIYDKHRKTFAYYDFHEH